MFLLNSCLVFLSRLVMSICASNLPPISWIISVLYSYCQRSAHSPVPNNLFCGLAFHLSLPSWVTSRLTARGLAFRSEILCQTLFTLWIWDWLISDFHQIIQDFPDWIYFCLAWANSPPPFAFKRVKVWWKKTLKKSAEFVQTRLLSLLLISVSYTQGRGSLCVARSIGKAAL